MKEKTHESHLQALDVGIARSRQEIALVADGLKKLAQTGNDESAAEGEHPPAGPARADADPGGWTAFRRRLAAAAARGGEVGKGLADEIQRHPLIGAIATFGLGFATAKLLFQRRKAKGSRP